LERDNSLIKEIEALLRGISSPHQAKTYLNLKKVDRDLTRIKPKDEVMIESGAGLCLDLLFWVGKKVKLHGLAVDLDKKALKIAKSWSKELGVHSRMDFCLGDAVHQPLRSGQADVSVSFSSIEHLPDRRLAQRWINEMSRITREDGTVVLTTSNRLWPSYTILQILKRVSRAWNIDELFFHPYDLRSMIEKAGLYPVAFGGRGLYYYNLIPSRFPGAAHLHLGFMKLLNIFQSLSFFSIISGRIGFRAVKKSIAKPQRRKTLET